MHVEEFRRIKDPDKLPSPQSSKCTRNSVCPREPHTPWEKVGQACFDHNPLQDQTVYHNVNGEQRLFTSSPCFFLFFFSSFWHPTMPLLQKGLSTAPRLAPADSERHGTAKALWPASTLVPVANGWLVNACPKGTRYVPSATLCDVVFRSGRCR